MWLAAAQRATCGSASPAACCLLPARPPPRRCRPGLLPRDQHRHADWCGGGPAKATRWPAGQPRWSAAAAGADRLLLPHPRPRCARRLHAAVDQRSDRPLADADTDLTLPWQPQQLVSRLLRLLPCRAVSSATASAGATLLPRRAALAAAGMPTWRVCHAQRPCCSAASPRLQALQAFGTRCAAGRGAALLFG